MDLPQPDQQALPVPAVPAQRPGDGPAGGPEKPRPRAGRRNWRLILVIVVASLSTLCAGGALTAYVLYDKATTPDLGTPTGAVRQYLNAYLGERNDAHAARFACGGRPDLAGVKAARDDVVSRERQFGVSIHASTDTIRITSQTSRDATVDAHIVLATVLQGSSQRAVEQWTFQVHNDGGWRVCDGHEVD